MGTLERLQRANGMMMAATHWALALANDDYSDGSLVDAKARAAARIKRARALRDAIAKRAGWTPAEYCPMSGSVMSWDTGSAA